MSLQPLCPHCRYFVYLDKLGCPNCEAALAFHLPSRASMHEIVSRAPLTLDEQIALAVPSEVETT